MMEEFPINYSYHIFKKNIFPEEPVPSNGPRGHPHPLADDLSPSSDPEKPLDVPEPRLSRPPIIQNDPMMSAMDPGHAGHLLADEPASRTHHHHLLTTGHILQPDRYG